MSGCAEPAGYLAISGQKWQWDSVWERSLFPKDDRGQLPLPGQRCPLARRWPSWSHLRRPTAKPMRSARSTHSPVTPVSLDWPPAALSSTIRSRRPWSKPATWPWSLPTITKLATFSTRLLQGLQAHEDSRIMHFLGDNLLLWDKWSARWPGWGREPLRPPRGLAAQADATRTVSTPRQDLGVRQDREKEGWPS